jgi:hypothetical protein
VARGEHQVREGLDHSRATTHSEKACYRYRLGQDVREGRANQSGRWMQKAICRKRSLHTSRTEKRRSDLFEKVGITSGREGTRRQP